MGRLLIPFNIDKTASGSLRDWMLEVLSMFGFSEVVEDFPTELASQLKRIKIESKLLRRSTSDKKAYIRLPANLFVFALVSILKLSFLQSKRYEYS